MSYTLATFRSSLRYTLSDQAVWKDTQINNWINSAIRDYSNHFPRIVTATFSTTIGKRNYDVVSVITSTGKGETVESIIAFERVEYPYGQTPPRFLSRLPDSNPNFYGGPYYDIQGEPPLYLWLGETPTSVQTVGVVIQTIHTILNADATKLTVPDNHVDILRNYVFWKASQYLEGYAAIDPARKSAMINALGKTSIQAEKFYYWSIEKAMDRAGQSGVSGPWSMDDKDRIY